MKLAISGTLVLVGLVAVPVYAPVALLLQGLGAWLLWGYFRAGGIPLAVAAFKRGNLSRVRRLLRHTYWPRLLSRGNQPYYFWMRGAILMADCCFADARMELLLASAGDIRSENDRSLIQCLLAEAALQLDDMSAAERHLGLAQRLEHHEQVDRLIGKIRGRIVMPVEK